MIQAIHRRWNVLPDEAQNFTSISMETQYTCYKQIGGEALFELYWMKEWRLREARDSRGREEKWRGEVSLGGEVRQDLCK